MTKKTFLLLIIGLIRLGKEKRIGWPSMKTKAPSRWLLNPQQYSNINLVLWGNWWVFWQHLFILNVLIDPFVFIRFWSLIHRYILGDKPSAQHSSKLNFEDLVQTRDTDEGGSATPSMVVAAKVAIDFLGKNISWPRWAFFFLSMLKN